MRLAFCLFFSLIIFGFTPKTSAQSFASCLPAWTSLQSIEILDTTKDYDFSHSLEGENASGRYTTKVVVDGHYNAQTKQLTLTTHFQNDFNGVSLPFNLFSALVIEAGQVNGWQDFTKECNGPGVGFYPGQMFQMPAFKLKGSGKETVQFMIWGSIN